MAAPGANIVYGRGVQSLWRDLFKKMGIVPQGMTVRQSVSKRGGVIDPGTDTTRRTAIGYKRSATAPTTDTAADAPTGYGDLCIHYSAAGVLTGVYRCSAYVSSSSFTWAQIA